MHYLFDMIAAHYADEDLETRIEAALPRGGTLSPLQLAPLDQFHVGGLAATIEMAEMARLMPGERVLDVGSGLGGPSRVLAALAAVEVVGLDLTAPYCRLAERLSERCHLLGSVEYRVGDALDMPFEAGRFDVACSQHVAMNIEDRARLYGEMHRVLEPAGRVVFYDVVATGSGDLPFPLPWAREPAHSHLVTADRMRALLAAAGFTELAWRDKTQTALSSLPAPDAVAPPLGLQVVMGPDFGLMLRNLRQAIETGQVGLVMYLGRA